MTTTKINMIRSISPSLCQLHFLYLRRCRSYIRKYFFTKSFQSNVHAIDWASLWLSFFFVSEILLNTSIPSHILNSFFRIFTKCRWKNQLNTLQFCYGFQMRSMCSGFQCRFYIKTITVHWPFGKCCRMPIKIFSRRAPKFTNETFIVV